MDKWKVESGLKEIEAMLDQAEKHLFELYKITGYDPAFPSPFNLVAESLKKSKMEVQILIKNLGIIL